MVAFDIGGLPDIVAHGQTGWLAPAFDIEGLAEGITWVLAQRETGRLAEPARERAVAQFAYSMVAKAYRQVYAACGSSR